MLHNIDASENILQTNICRLEIFYFPSIRCRPSEGETSSVLVTITANTTKTTPALSMCVCSVRYRSSEMLESLEINSITSEDGFSKKTKMLWKSNGFIIIFSQQIFLSALHSIACYNTVMLNKRWIEEKKIDSFISEFMNEISIDIPFCLSHCLISLRFFSLSHFLLPFSFCNSVKTPDKSDVYVTDKIGKMKTL